MSAVAAGLAAADFGPGFLAAGRAAREAFDRDRTGAEALRAAGFLAAFFAFFRAAAREAAAGFALPFEGLLPPFPALPLAFLFCFATVATLP